jgi:phosphoesterase RecJ-like protein
MINTVKAAEFFKNNNNYTILCHVNPDGDTLGSGYALCGALHILGKQARVICDDKPSPRFDYLLNCLDNNVRLLQVDVAKEVIVTVDVADTDLLGELKNKYPKIDMCIDHHISNTDYAAATLLDTSAAACAEVTWNLIKELVGSETLKSADCGAAIAGAIYTGISTDTGCFKYSNTTADTHLIAAELMNYGFDFQRINYVMFEMKTRERVELEKQAFAGIQYFFEGKCAVITLTAAMLEGIDPEDASNVSALPKQIDGVVTGVVIKERGEGVYKVSVRSSSEVNAQIICNTLGGGGHLRAAGCTLTGDLDSVREMILKEIQKQLN